MHLFLMVGITSIFSEYLTILPPKGNPKLYSCCKYLGTYVLKTRKRTYKMKDGKAKKYSHLGKYEIETKLTDFFLSPSQSGFFYF